MKLDIHILNDILINDNHTKNLGGSRAQNLESWKEACKNIS